MHSVGDVVDRNLVLRKFRPEVLPHLSCDLLVLLADAVAIGRHSEGEGCHVESCGRIFRIYAKRIEGVTVQLKQGNVRAKILVHQPERKHIVARRDWRVGCEDGCGLYLL